MTTADDVVRVGAENLLQIKNIGLRKLIEIREVLSIEGVELPVPGWVFATGRGPMTKQMISFTDPQRKFLIREAKRLGISIAELVRRIIDAHIETNK